MSATIPNAARQCTDRRGGQVGGRGAAAGAGRGGAREAGHGDGGSRWKETQEDGQKGMNRKISLL